MFEKLQIFSHLLRKSLMENFIYVQWYECLQTTIFLKHWYISEKLTMFFSEAVNECDNLIVMGDFKIDIRKTDCSRYHNIEEFVISLISRTRLNLKYAIPIITNQHLIYF